MTYRELLDKLHDLTPAQLDTEVLYQDTNDGEFYGIRGIHPGEEDGYYAEVGLPADQVLLRIVQ